MPTYFDQLVRQWGHALLEQIPHIVQALIVAVLTLYAADRLQRVVQRVVGEGEGRPELVRLLGRLVRIGTLLGGLLIILSIFEQTQLLVSFITSLGIFGLLIAFALQDITKNFTAGVLLLIQRPFGLNDRIRVGAFEGTITDVSLRATILRTVEGHEVMIPNAEVYSGTITNLTRYPLRRHTVVVTLPLEVDTLAARQALETTLRHVPHLEHEPQAHIASTAVGKDDQQFEARFWLPSAAPETPAIVSAVTLALQEEVQSIRRQQAVASSQ